MPAHKGTKHHAAKLNADLVRELRARHQGGVTHYRNTEWLLSEHGVDVGHSAVREATVGETWAHVV